MRFLLIMLSVFFACTVSAAASDTTPQRLCKQLRREASAIVMTPELSARLALTHIFFAEHFATPEFLSHTLWDDWKKLDAEKRAHLIDVFQTVLAKNIVRRLSDTKAAELSPFRLLRIDTVDGARIGRYRGKFRGTDVSFDILLIPIEGSWKIVDVTIEGASMRVNYEGHFGYLINKYGIDGLIARVERAAEKPLSVKGSDDGIHRQDHRGDEPL